MRLPHMTLSQISTKGLRPWLAGLCVGALLLLPGMAAAQDSDDDGVLPYTSTTSPAQPNPAGGGTGGSPASHDGASGVVGVTSAIESQQIDASVARIRVHAVSGQATVAENVPADQATFDAKAGTVLAQPAGNDVLLQGEGAIIVPETLPMKLEPAEKAVARTAVLMLDSGSATLDALLSGKAHPAQIMVLGDVTAASLQVFEALVSRHAQDLPGVHATLVFLSVDKHGQQHLSAVRAATEGGPLEVVTR